MKNNRKKRNIIIGLLTALVLLALSSVCFYVYQDKYPIDRKIAEMIFGIDMKEYTVLEKENTLQKHKYGGKYVLLLEVKEEQKDELLTKLQEAYYYKCDYQYPEEKVFIEAKQNYINRTLGWEKDKVEYILEYLGCPKINTGKSGTHSMTVIGRAYIKRSENGICEVYLIYVE